MKDYQALTLSDPTIAKRLERMLDKVSSDRGCWLFTGGCYKNGYGSIGVGGAAGGKALAHRVAWNLTHGRIPDGVLVLHECDIRNCCNPDHLFTGDNSVNQQDMLRKGRGNHQGKPGESNHNAKLTEAQVYEIRDLCERRALTQKAIARRYGISHALVSFIHTRRAWTHLP